MAEPSVKVTEGLHRITTLEESKDTPRTGNDYTVYLVNSCNWVVTKMKYVATGQVVSYPQPIGRTCNSPDCASCAANGQMRAIIVTPCDEPPYQIQLFCQHPNGAMGWTNLLSVNPSCDRAGEYNCMNIPDPA